MKTKRTKVEQAKLDQEIMRRLSEFHSVRDITKALSTSWLTVTKRAERGGYKKQLITDEERELLLRRRKEMDARIATILQNDPVAGDSISSTNEEVKP